MPAMALPSLNDPDQWVTCPSIPIFDEHADTSKPAPFDRVDKALLETIATNSQRRIDDTGDKCPVVLRHTPKKGSNNHEQPPIVGYASNFRVAQFGRVNPRSAIYADLEFPKSYTEELRGFPRRSVEIWPQDKIIDPVALLGSETPQRDLGLLQFGKLQYSNHSDGQQPLTYSIDREEGNPNGAANSSEETPSVAMDMQEFIQQFMACPAGQWIQKQMEAEAAAAAQPIPPPGAPPAAPPPAAAAPPPAPSGPPSPPDDDKENTKLRMQREEQDARIKSMEAELTELRAANEETAKKLSYARRERSLADLQKQGYHFDRAAVLEHTEAMDERSFNGFMDFAKLHFRRGPENTVIRTKPIADGGGDLERETTKEERDKIIAYAKAHNCSYEAAKDKLIYGR